MAVDVRTTVDREGHRTERKQASEGTSSCTRLLSEYDATLPGLTAHAEMHPTGQVVQNDDIALNS
jgi:hypothetical protein